MKFRFSILIVLVMVIAAATYAQGKPTEATMIIRVEKTAVRAGPSFASPVLLFAAYRTPVAVVQIENDWVLGFVQGLSKPGYIHISALAPAKVNLSSDAASAPPPLQESEIVLAGKGFSSTLESALKDGNAFNFDAVDEMEKLSYSFAECLAFIQGIDVSPGEL